ncbi:uncharacterized protein LOC127700736 [Mytilus californianus]|uniref:uncharacterized protein LOC127700736 n=1 Tax=Mytilus californianus TaxID=6549 RepID=UPI002246C589|nr:uncharacterized protein LOC127700736 [Mytilus californianus]
MTGWRDFLLLCFLFNPTWTRFVLDPNARGFVVDPNARGFIVDPSARRGVQSDVYIVSNRANIRIHHDGDRYKVRRRITPDGIRPSLSAAGKTDVKKVSLSGDGGVSSYNQRTVNGRNGNEQSITNDKNIDVRIVSNDDFIKRKSKTNGRSDIDQPVVNDVNVSDQQTTHIRSTVDQSGSNIEVVNDQTATDGESNVVQSAPKNGIVNGHQATNINDIVSQSTFDGSTGNDQSISNGGTDDGLQTMNKPLVIDMTHGKLKSRVEQGDVLISRKDNGPQFSSGNGQANENIGNTDVLEDQQMEQTVGGSDGRVVLIGLNAQNQGQNINDVENGQMTVTPPPQNQVQNGMQSDNVNSGTGQNEAQFDTDQSSFPVGNEQTGSQIGIDQTTTSTEAFQTSPQTNFDDQTGQQQGTDETSTQPDTFSTGNDEETIPTTPPTTPAIPTDVETTFSPVTNEQEQEETRITPVDELDVTTTPRDETEVGKTRKPRQQEGREREEVEPRESKEGFEKRQDHRRKSARDEDEDWWESDSWEFNSWDSDSLERNFLSEDRQRKVKAGDVSIIPVRPYHILKKADKFESDSSDWDSELYTNEDTSADKHDTRKEQVLNEEGDKRKNRIKKRVNYESSSDDSFWDSFEDSDSGNTDNLFKPVKTKLTDEKQTKVEQPTVLRKHVRRSRTEYSSSDSTEYDYSDGVDNYKDDDKKSLSKFHDWAVTYDSSDSWDDSDSGYWEDSEYDRKRLSKPTSVKSKLKSNLIYHRRPDDDDSWYSDSWEDSSEPRRTSKNVRVVKPRLTDKSSPTVKTDHERKDSKSYRLRRGNDYSWESDSSWESDGWEYYDDSDEYESKAKTQLTPIGTGAAVARNEIRRRHSFAKQYDDNSDNDDNGNMRLRLKTTRRGNRILNEPNRSDSKRRLHFKLSGRVLLNRPHKKTKYMFNDYETSDDESEYVRPLKKNRKKSGRKELFLLDTTK